MDTQQQRTSASLAHLGKAFLTAQMPTQAIYHDLLFRSYVLAALSPPLQRPRSRHTQHRDNHSGCPWRTPPQP
ncbi:hypothetical protein ACFTZF_34025 [Streptomyces mirabilis]|uniref:hypothetical protein n=1 Tax=Streptomyces mirabilis TaxID=68239 RepID=UPI00363CB166